MGFISLLMIGFSLYLINKSYTSRYFEEIEAYNKAVSEWNSRNGPDFQNIGDVYLLPERCQDAADESCRIHKLMKIQKNEDVEKQIAKIHKDQEKVINAVKY